MTTSREDEVLTPDDPRPAAPTPPEEIRIPQVVPQLRGLAVDRSEETPTCGPQGCSDVRGESP